MSACTAQDDPDCRLWCSVGKRNIPTISPLLSYPTSFPHLFLFSFSPSFSSYYSSSSSSPSSSSASSPSENDNGFHRGQTSAWSHCSSNCPKTYSKTGVCQPPNKPHYLREEFPSKATLRGDISGLQTSISVFFSPGVKREQ